ncbi:MAG: exo-alpha-sialidase, partial [Bacteroidales bacterium]
PLIDIEPATGPEASWITPFITPTGRIYGFYTYNSENLREVLDSQKKSIKRVDTLGKMMMKYSDDGGYTWSKERYEVPIRNFEIDDNNVYQGKIQFFWSVALPIIHKDAVYLPLSKVGNFGEGLMESGSGAILKSSNILTEQDPAKIKWVTLPDGNIGLLPPKGKVADEHNIVSLSDGSLYCVYRTNQGHNVQTYSRDNGHTWTTPEWATYTPGGKLMNQPRCLNKIYKFKNGKYAIFFHNNSSRNYQAHPLGNRNPTWLAGGVEKDGYIYWSQPEIFLYDMDYSMAISYPDWIEDNGEYYFTETQKRIARVHKIPNEYLEMLWTQADKNTLTKDGLALELSGNECKPLQKFTMPPLGNLYKGNGFSLERNKDLSLKGDKVLGNLKTLYRGNGFSLELKFTTDYLKKDQVLLNTRRKITEGVGQAAKYAGNGLKISILKTGELEFIMDDGRTPLIWNSGSGTIKPKVSNHIVIIVDADAKILTFVINGDLWDGGDRPFGYARFNPFMWDVNGETQASFCSDFKGKMESFRVYRRPLFTSEAIGNYRSGIK